MKWLMFVKIIIKLIVLEPREKWIINHHDNRSYTNNIFLKIWIEK
jgi:hypothetical protein